MQEQKNVSWPAVFVAYSNGDAVLDICREFGISVPELTIRAKNENWGRLREELPVSADITTTDFGQANLDSLARIKENRERNFRVVEKLRLDLEKRVEDLLEDRLTVIEFKTTKDGVHEVERPMGIRDRVELARYAEAIFKMSYEALGDFSAIKGAGSPDGKGGVDKVVFQINMPSAVSEPRPVKIRSEAAVVEI